MIAAIRCKNRLSGIQSVVCAFQVSGTHDTLHARGSIFTFTQLTPNSAEVQEIPWLGRIRTVFIT